LEEKHRIFEGFHSYGFFPMYVIWFTRKMKEQFLRMTFLWSSFTGNQTWAQSSWKFSWRENGRLVRLARSFPAPWNWVGACVFRQGKPSHRSVNQNKKPSPIPIAGQGTIVVAPSPPGWPADTRRRRRRWPPHHQLTRRRPHHLCTRRREALPIAYHRAGLPQRRWPNLPDLIPSHLVHHSLRQRRTHPCISRLLFSSSLFL
jgi:hypothetical protein